MKKLIIVVTAMFFASAAFAARTYLYVSHNQAKKISVIDTATNQLMNEIKLPCFPKDMELSPDDQYLYFTGFDTNALYRIKTKNLSLDQDFVSVGFGPVTLGIRPDGKTAYVANSKSKNISIVDLDAFDAKADPVELPGAPKAIAISPDGRRAYIALAEQEGIAVLDLNTNAITGVIPSGADPWAMVITDNRLFVTNEGMSSISVIDIRKNSMINEIVTTDNPRGIAYFGGMLYVAVMNGVDMFETARYEKPASASLDYETYGAAAGKVPSGGVAYIAGYNKAEGKGKIAVINPVENEVTEEIDIAGWPMYLEMRKIWAAPVPVKTATPVPAATAVPEPTIAPTQKPVVKPAPKPTAKPTPKPKKKATPKPTQVPVPAGLTSAISGRVFMENNPVSKVRIKAMSKHSDRVYTIYTDEAGSFIFPALPIGAYVLSIEATYIIEKAVPITVNKGKNAGITINVKKR
jgi:YVTN family beta-propeller protein